jgi:hypothetical protein
MTFRIAKRLFVGLLAIAPLGCEPRPVVVTPDADDDTTVIEERDVEVEREDPAMPPPQSGPSVDVDVGGGKGVDVDVNRDAKNESQPNP